MTKKSAEELYEAPELTPQLITKARRVSPAAPANCRLVLTGETGGMVQARFVHGGVRPGAGRKPLGHVRVTLSLSPDARRRLVARAKRERKTMSDLVTGLL